jgi:hypothetical protein
MGMRKKCEMRNAKFEMRKFDISHFAFRISFSLQSGAVGHVFSECSKHRLPFFAHRSRQ